MRNDRSSVMFCIPKELENLSDCQDVVGRNSAASVFCIADGVGQSFFPAVWAKTLVQSFTNLSDEQLDQLFVNMQLDSWLVAQQDQWLDEVKEIVSESGPEKYYLRNRLREQKPGASTFAALNFYADGGTPKWRSLSIGDCCIFQIRKNSLVKSFIPTASSDFDNFPAYFASIGNQIHRPQYLEGEASLEDTFVLASDALAKWLLTLHETRENDFSGIVMKLVELSKLEEFRGLVDSARTHDISLDDDDTSIIIINCARLSAYAGVDTGESHTSIIDPAASESNTLPNKRPPPSSDID